MRSENGMLRSQHEDQGDDETIAEGNEQRTNLSAEFTSKQREVANGV